MLNDIRDKEHLGRFFVHHVLPSHALPHVLVDSMLVLRHKWTAVILGTSTNKSCPKMLRCILP